MFQIIASCICNAKPEAGGNRDNLLFAGQILPEANAGLEGTPELKVKSDSVVTAAVFSGFGSNGIPASYYAASCFHAAELHSGKDLETLMGDIHQELAVKAAHDSGCSAAAVCVFDDRLCISNLGNCRVYLLRGKSLYLLSRHREGAFLGAANSSDWPYLLSGKPQPGDQLLLCSRGFSDALTEQAILKQLSAADTGANALQQLLAQAGPKRTQDSFTAVLLRFHESADSHS